MDHHYHRPAYRTNFNSTEISPCIFDNRRNARSCLYSRRALAAIAEESGLNLKLVQTPAKRSVTSLRQGLIDAEITRIPSFAETYPEGIMVSVPLTSISYFAYSARSDIEVKGWESLSPYKIVTVRGFQFVNEFLSGHQTQTVNSIKIALK